MINGQQCKKIKIKQFIVSVMILLSYFQKTFNLVEMSNDWGSQPQLIQAAIWK